MVSQIFEMGKKYKQRDEVTHMAVELLDRFFMSSNPVALNPSHYSQHSSHYLHDQSVHNHNGTSPSSTSFEFTPKNNALYTLTMFLIASKNEELDENIPLIKDLTRHFSRILPTSVPIPTFNDIVECERQLMNHFKWDLMILTPTVFLQSLLSNGIVFDNEELSSEAQQVQLIVKSITDRASSNLRALTKDLHLFRDKRSSHLACVVIYLARKDEYSELQTQPDSWS